MPLYIIPEDVQTIYEGITSDWRSQTNLLQQTASGASSAGYTSKKYNQNSARGYYSNRVPLIRLPEMYYIAAECYATGSTPNPGLAMERLNTIREKRGIYTPLTGLDAAQIMEEVAKEYRKGVHRRRRHVLLLQTTPDTRPFLTRRSRWTTRSMSFPIPISKPRWAAYNNNNTKTR